MGPITLHPYIIDSTLLDILNKVYRYFAHSDADMEQIVNKTFYLRNILHSFSQKQSTYSIITVLETALLTGCAIVDTCGILYY